MVVDYDLLGIFTKTPESWNYGKKGDIILIPGINENIIFLIDIANKINSLGYRIHYIKDWDSRDNITNIADKIGLLISNQKMHKVFIIAHSKGGLVAKYFIDNNKNSYNVKYAFTFATPYGGSILAKRNLFKSMAEMSPNSLLLKSIISKNNNSHKIINIYPKFDNHVIPNKNLYLDGAKENIMIDIVGHTRILNNKELVEIIKKHID